jgi:glutathione S-transferase
MITLCGTPISNYYNKVKLALLEKGIPFDEERTGTPGIGLVDPAQFAYSPLGKVPFVRTEHGSLCESQVIVDYIEARWPEPPLLPADPFGAAKVREIATFADLHLELVVRELDANKERVKAKLVKHIHGFRQLARFSPYVAGETFTLADCSAWAHLPVAVLATKAIYGEDLLAAGGIEVRAYTSMLAERPSIQRVVTDRKAEQTALAAVPAKAR